MSDQYEKLNDEINKYMAAKEKRIMTAGYATPFIVFDLLYPDQYFPGDIIYSRERAIFNRKVAIVQWETHFYVKENKYPEFAVSVSCETNKNEWVLYEPPILSNSQFRIKSEVARMIRQYDLLKIIGGGK